MSLIEIRDVSKNHGGLRPFRLQAFSLDAGDSVAIEGPDRQSAAVFTDLLTGTTLPDTGVVVVDGRPTSALSSQDEWLAFLDRFGIVNERVVLLDELSIAQNLAVPLTLDLDPLPAAVRRRAEALAADVGLHRAIDTPIRNHPPVVRWLVRLGRAVALSPAILLIEHPTADLGNQPDAVAVGDAIRRVRASRPVATILIGSDPRLPRRVTSRSVTWRPATGEIIDARTWRRWVR